MSQRWYVARSADVAARVVGGEMMVISIRDSTLFVLNRTAALLWEAADGATRLDDIVEQRICGAYDVDPASALRDAEELAEQLAGHGLFVLSDEPVPADAAREGHR